MSDEGDLGGRLEEISAQLDAAARKLADAEVTSEEATRLAGECAELASQAVAELDRLASGAAQETVSGQEELL
jgi:F0F1-type ATP synthase membrane subunit b/b'